MAQFEQKITASSDVEAVPSGFYAIFFSNNKVYGKNASGDVILVGPGKESYAVAQSEGNTTSTAIVATNTYAVISNSQTVTTELANFTQTIGGSGNTILTYTGTTETFEISSIVNFTSTATDVCAFKVFINSVAVGIPFRQTATAQVQNVSIVYKTVLRENDTVEIRATNETNTNSLTVSEIIISIS